MNNLRDLAANEPALIVGLVVALLGMASAYGLALTQEMIGATVAFVGALLAVVSALATRARVTPSSGGFTVHRRAKDDEFTEHGQRRS